MTTGARRRRRKKKEKEREREGGLKSSPNNTANGYMPLATGQENGPIPEDPPKIPEEERKGKGREKTKTFSRTSVLLGNPSRPKGSNIPGAPKAAILFFRMPTLRAHLDRKTTRAWVVFALEKVVHSEGLLTFLLPRRILFFRMPTHPTSTP